LRVLSIQGSGKVLLNARVGSGKTFVALACASTIISNDTGYMSKVLYACPLVALAKEQSGLIRRYCTTQEKQHPALRVQSAAYRAGKETSTNIRKAQFVVAIFEHCRDILASSLKIIYPGSQRMNRTYRDAVKLVIFDEVHYICSRRGGVISMILGICTQFGIPVLMLSGTTNKKITRCLSIHYPHMLYIDEADNRQCIQIPIRIDNEKSLRYSVSRSCSFSFLSTRKNNGWIIFCRTVKKVYKTFLWMYSSMKQCLEEEMETNYYGLSGKAREILDVVEESSIGEIPEGFHVRLSGSPNETGKKTMKQVLVDEKRTAWQAFSLGIAYNWRDVGEEYTKASLEAFHDGFIVLIISTSTFFTGGNVDGVRNVAIMCPDLFSLHQ
jgi:hypothetical protein